MWEPSQKEFLSSYDFFFFENHPNGLNGLRGVKQQADRLNSRYSSSLTPFFVV